MASTRSPGTNWPAWAQHVPFDGHTLATVLTLSWAVFVVNTGIQFPLLVRFGYTRVNILATALPLALIVGTLYRMHLAVPSVWGWLPLVWVAGAAAIVLSAAVAVRIDRRRTGFR